LTCPLDEFLGADAQLDLPVKNEKDLAGDGQINGSPGCSDLEIIVSKTFKMLWEARKRMKP